MNYENVDPVMLPEELVDLCERMDGRYEKHVISCNALKLAKLIDSATNICVENRTRLLIASGALLEAVVELVPEEWGYMLSRSPGGRHLASVFDPLSDKETMIEADSDALALLGAIAAAIAQVRR